MQEATTFNIFYHGTSVQHLATVLTFNAGIKSLRATLPDEIFTGDFSS
jgi:hypothetical protein